jgi:hypothetical protein
VVDKAVKGHQRVGHALGLKAQIFLKKAASWSNPIQNMSYFEYLQVRRTEYTTTGILMAVAVSAYSIGRWSRISCDHDVGFDGNLKAC